MQTSSKKSKFVVAHFYRPETKRCEILDMHFKELAKKYVMCKFIKINAEKNQFLCEKLHIWCLPTLVLIKEGKTEHSILGFGEFGNRDDFKRDT